MELNGLKFTIACQVLDHWFMENETDKIDVRTHDKIVAYADHVAQIEDDPLSTSTEERYADFLRYNYETTAG